MLRPRGVSARGVLVALVVGSAVLVAAPRRAGRRRRPGRPQAVAAADAFLDRYLQPTGGSCAPTRAATRSARGRRTGCSSPSALGDEERFRHIWAWTDEHLQRDDGLLAWRWADGGVVDDQAAADADLLAAGALALAGQRFGDADLVADAPS